MNDIKGNTIVWNQLIQLNTAVNYSAVSIERITGTNTWNVTTNGLNQGIRWENIAVTSNHKYFVRFCVETTESIPLRIMQYDGSQEGTTVTVNGKQTISGIFTQTKDVLQRFGIQVRTNYNGTFKVGDPLCIDLTQMFGSTVATQITVNQFESMFPSDYYPYNEGTLISLNPTSVVSTGFNLCDEQWESGRISTQTGQIITDVNYSHSGFISCIPNTTYYSNTWLHIFYYDVNKTYIGNVDLGGNGRTFTTLTNAAYFRLDGGVNPSTMNNYKICINLSDINKNGTYLPYQKEQTDLSWIQSINYTPEGETTPVQLFPNGLCSAGTVYDEITPTKAIKRVGSVDLGSFSWNMAAPSSGVYANSFYTNQVLTERAKIVARGNVWNTFITTKGYLPTSAFGQGYITDKKLCTINGNGVVVLIGDNSYSSAASFKSAMQGVMLYYELETPIEVPINHTIEYAVQPGGTEQLLPENQPNTLPVTSEIKMDVTYPLNAVGTIQNLPYNYMNERTLDSLISVLNTAVTGYTFSKTTANGYLQITATATPTT